MSRQRALSTPEALSRAWKTRPAPRGLHDGAKNVRRDVEPRLKTLTFRTYRRRCAFRNSTARRADYVVVIKRINVDSEDDLNRQ